MSISHNNKVQCQWCFQKFSQCGGGLANHLWQSQPCQRKFKEAQMQFQSGSHNSPGTATQVNFGYNDSDLPYDDYQHPDTYMSPVSDVGNGDQLNKLGGKLIFDDLEVVVDDNAGRPLPGQAKTVWDNLASQDNEGKPYSPFTSKGEWEPAYWLSTEGLLKGVIGHFLKLKWVHFLVGNMTQVKHHSKINIG